MIVLPSGLESMRRALPPSSPYLQGIFIVYAVDITDMTNDDFRAGNLRPPGQIRLAKDVTPRKCTHQNRNVIVHDSCQCFNVDFVNRL